MGRIGLSDVFFLAKNYEFDGSFVMTQKTLIDKEDNQCNKDPNYSFQVRFGDLFVPLTPLTQDCILSWVATTAGCHLDWFSAPPGNFSRVCSVKEDITK